MILVLGVLFLLSFSLDENKKEFPNENWWVFKKNDGGQFVNKKRFFGKKEAFKFYKDHSLSALINYRFCGNGAFYTLLEGDWNYINDSVIELYYGKQSDNLFFTEKVLIKWKSDKVIKLKTLNSERSLYPRKPKPFLD